MRDDKNLTRIANLLRQADLAMTQAKRGGRGSVQVFHKSMDAAVHGQLHLETRLRHALDSGGLHLHYQPQVDAGTGDLLGFEALVRWTDARLGLVAPARFVPLAEEAGLIGQLGAWVLDEACRQAAAWDLRVPIAVNVSALEVAQEDFTQRVHDTLRRHGLDGGQLKLEITERLTVQDLQRVARQLAQVQALGVQLSLDDFGTGQSSVSTLLQLPLNELKLDRSLITGVAESPIEQRVVGALIGLGRSLNLTVIVEGVETPGQLQALRELGCGAVQGYLVGRPGPASMWTPQLGGPLPLELPERGGAEGGEARIVFGDGEQGRRVPVPPGARAVNAYSHGGGATGHLDDALFVLAGTVASSDQRIRLLHIADAASETLADVPETTAPLDAARRALGGQREHEVGNEVVLVVHVEPRLVGDPEALRLREGREREVELGAERVLAKV